MITKTLRNNQKHMQSIRPPLKTTTERLNTGGTKTTTERLHTNTRTKATRKGFNTRADTKRDQKKTQNNNNNNTIKSLKITEGDTETTRTLRTTSKRH